ncbi:hypothetical protein PENSUB_2885 [Penicillium subrubescens]|uniref:Uncharacterized protein n=1 Tax=Penicillium subrubescens TaxID=1316194 RepID=A0A1Q5UGK6_9EURO|nr:hypothetical protein PENSUB_2885 [Penicillium subrubescens]
MCPDTQTGTGQLRDACSKEAQSDPEGEGGQLSVQKRDRSKAHGIRDGFVAEKRRKGSKAVIEGRDVEHGKVDWGFHRICPDTQTGYYQLRDACSKRSQVTPAVDFVVELCGYVNGRTFEIVDWRPMCRERKRMIDQGPLRIYPDMQLVAQLHDACPKDKANIVCGCCVVEGWWRDSDWRPMCQVY